MDEVLTVRRWRRYGADRLYVTHETGARVGSVDLQSGEVVADDPVLEARVRRAAQAYLRSDVPELVLPVTSELASLDALDEAGLEAWLGDGDDHPRGERGSPVGARLDRLADDGWQAVHDVPLGRQGSVVEHLLVGPGGIYTITERRHPGSDVRVAARTIHVDGRSVPYLRDARLEAARVQGLLLAAGCAGAGVRAVLVITGDLSRDAHDPPQDALVIARHEVPNVFRRLPERLDPARVSAIAQVARRRTTWAR
ncbi:NERD domain-containing protein [Cellulomonas wangsupingiae]|uniref:NERD domain-containing protein n=1 Tax=Cellulomonas wangsupingiae TaxID=2968085 RepID=A0ABY5K2W6_9CELL|nr:NERD domain-containing protein [Cellulomonas wangsupingiae]MCC2335476.1 NERD domain-containing protein [Cellulomonas wangsupingiae]MCM0639994.1 NERD domain-containing protein [Cellulomonas wangsupingiae]UUI64350.1 NERD domain-containing protein [Cellulomonas wangsupingiae]